MTLTTTSLCPALPLARPQTKKQQEVSLFQLSSHDIICCAVLCCASFSLLPVVTSLPSGRDIELAGDGARAAVLEPPNSKSQVSKIPGKHSQTRTSRAKCNKNKEKQKIEARDRVRNRDQKRRLPLCILSFRPIAQTWVYFDARKPKVETRASGG